MREVEISEYADPAAAGQPLITTDAEKTSDSLESSCSSLPVPTYHFLVPSIIGNPATGISSKVRGSTISPSLLLYYLLLLCMSSRLQGSFHFSPWAYRLLAQPVFLFCEFCTIGQEAEYHSSQLPGEGVGGRGRFCSSAIFQTTAIQEHGPLFQWLRRIHSE